MLDPKLQPKEIFDRREEFGLSNSVKMLTEIIDKDKNGNKRQGAIKYLGLVSKDVPELKKECFATLENILISEDAIEIKCEAARALGKLKYDKALKPLNWILEQKEINANLKISALKAIKKIKFEDSEIGLFIEELDSDFNDIKEFVRNQLLTLDLDTLIKNCLAALIKKNLSDSHKSEIIKIIGYQLSGIDIPYEDTSYLEVKYPEVISDLKNNKKFILEEVSRILKEEDQELLDSIIRILKLFGSEINRDILNLLMTDDFIVKENAIIISGKLKIIDAVDLLVENLDSIYNEVSLASIKALGEIADLSAIPELLDILNIEDVSFEYTDIDMKFQIIDAIKNIYLFNKNAPYDHLFTYLQKDNDTIRESIAFIFGEIGSKEFVKPLIDLLKIRNLDVKKNAAIALGKIGNIEALDQLIMILTNKDIYWLIKKVAADAIFNIFHRNWYRVKTEEEGLKRELNKYMASLIDYLGSNEGENYKVKLSLIKFLETYGDEKCLGALLKRVNDFHRVVRIYASNAIKKIEEKLELDADS
ncbi:MAG: HEAT repeat domain-containing protein [Candidatus Thorarchaeota archaeon]